MKNLFLLFLAIIITSFFSCQKDSSRDLDIILEAQIKQYSKGGSLSSLIIPTEIENIPQDPKNPITSEKVKLGQMLFHESVFSIHPKKDANKQTYSCASCHHSKAGFQACLPQGIGEGGLGFGQFGEGRMSDLTNYDPTLLDIQPIRSPSALNVAFQEAMLWNGQFGATGVNAGTESQWTPGTPKEVNNLGFEGVEIQAIAGLDVHRMEINSDLVSQHSSYKEMFDLAFSDVPEQDRYTNVTAGLAMAAYERTLLSDEAPFQKWLKGNTEALTSNQKDGAILFFGKAQCFNCHDGPALNSMEFHALGMNDLTTNNAFIHGLDDATKKGRAGFTQNDDDLYKFKVPQLYSLKYSPFYGHGSSFNTIREVLAYKNKGQGQNPNVANKYLSHLFQPLGLSQKEIDQLADFVENGLDDNNLDRYLPSSLPSGNCFPNNDEQSQIDLGCN